jgi:hypothetical protein
MATLDLNLEVATEEEVVVDMEHPLAVDMEGDTALLMEEALLGMAAGSLPRLSKDLLPGQILNYGLGSLQLTQTGPAPYLRLNCRGHLSMATGLLSSWTRSSS